MRTWPGPGLARDAVVSGVWSVTLGVLAGVLWWQLAPEVLATATADGVALDADQVPRQVGIDGWYAAIAGSCGLLTGVVLLSLRGRRPVAMVVLVTLGGALGSWLMLRLGGVLGPADPVGVLAGGPEGATAPLELRLQAAGLVWLWPAAAALGAVVQLLVLARPVSEESDSSAPESAESPHDHAGPG